MKKTVIYSLIGLIVLIILALIMPFGMGLIAQHKYIRILNNISQFGTVRVDLVKYNRGWFNSEATIVLKPTNLTLVKLNQWVQTQDQRVPLELVINQQIKHGPFLKITSPDGHTKWLFGQALINTYAKPFIGNVDAITFIAFNGSLVSALTSPQLNYVNSQNNLQVTINHPVATLRVSPSVDKLFFNLTIPDAALHTAEFNQKLTNLNTTNDFHRSQSGLMVGTKLTTIDLITWVTPSGQSHLELNGLLFKTQSQEKQAKISYTLQAALNRLMLDNVAYGEQHIELNVQNLDAATLVQMGNELRNLQTMKSFTPADIGRFSQLSMLLLSKGIDINIKKISLDTAWGKPVVAMQLSIKPQPDTQEAISLKQLLNNLNLQLFMQLPPPFLTQVAIMINQLISTNQFNMSIALNQMTTAAHDADLQQKMQEKIADWVQNGWLVYKDGSYQLNFVFENNQALINGQPFIRTLSVPMQNTQQTVQQTEGSAAPSVLSN